MNAAAIQAFDEVAALTAAVSREFAGSIYKQNGAFRFTPAQMGGVDWSLSAVAQPAQPLPSGVQNGRAGGQAPLQHTLGPPVVVSMQKPSPQGGRRAVAADGRSARAAAEAFEAVIAARSQHVRHALASLARADAAVALGGDFAHLAEPAQRQAQPAIVAIGAIILGLALDVATSVATAEGARLAAGLAATDQFLTTSAEGAGATTASRRGPVAPGGAAGIPPTLERLLRGPDPDRRRRRSSPFARLGSQTSVGGSARADLRRASPRRDATLGRTMAPPRPGADGPQARRAGFLGMTSTAEHASGSQAQSWGALDAALISSARCDLPPVALGCLLAIPSETASRLLTPWSRFPRLDGRLHLSVSCGDTGSVRGLRRLHRRLCYWDGLPVPALGNPEGGTSGLGGVGRADRGL